VLARIEPAAFHEILKAFGLALNLNRVIIERCSGAIARKKPIRQRDQSCVLSVSGIWTQRVARTVAYVAALSSDRSASHE
jgi:hypothetical protein